MRPGDIVLFERTYRALGCTHAGIYLGDNLFIHAANSRKGVIISSLLENYYYIRFVCGRRIIPSSPQPAEFCPAASHRIFWVKCYKPIFYIFTYNRRS